jgi:proteasome lid subunit RPN8/RPN11
MEEKKVYPIQPVGKGPRRAKMPLHRARRWLAAGENGKHGGVQVFMTQSAYQRICEHAQSDMDNEVGGWLAGRWCKDSETGDEFVVVEALLPAQQVRSGSTFLTFTHDSQVAMLAALEERYSTKGVVGWFHTHPRMGIFLSGYDLWLHEHFFPHPWQVALVVEPHSGQGGFFVRDEKNKLEPRKYFGFYELLNRKTESVMDWSNLKRDKKEIEAAIEPIAAETAAVEPPAKVEMKRKTLREFEGRVVSQAPVTPPVASHEKKIDIKVNPAHTKPDKQPKEDKLSEEAK